MSNIRKKLVLFSLILVSALTIFYGCDNNIYKNLNLSLSEEYKEVVLTDNPQDNVFNITATATGMPKGYDGGVVFSVPSNDAVEYVTSTKESGGKTVGSFLAKQPGNVTIDVVTLEGGITKQVTVKVIKPISSLKFTESIIPVVKGATTDISKFLKYDPPNTNQTEVDIELVREGANDELIRIQREGSKITIPTDFLLDHFSVVAKSRHNTEVIARAEAKVINLVPTSAMTLKHDNLTVENTEDDKVLTYSRGEYSIELAANTSDLHERNIYVDFGDYASEKTNYEVQVIGRTASGSIIQNGIDKGVVSVDINPLTNLLTIKGVGLGTEKLILNIIRKDFPTHTEFHQQIIVNVAVVSYPTNITITDGVKNLSELEIYANYDESMFGAQIKINVNNDYGVMNNENVILSLSGYEDSIQLYDRWRNPINFNEEVSANFVYYIKHSLATVPTDLELTVTSVKYPKIFTTIPIKIITQGINLTTQDGAKQGEVAADINYTEEVELGLAGVPGTFDYRTQLSVTGNIALTKNDSNPETIVYNSDFLTIYVTQSRIAFIAKDQIGKVTLYLAAPNGSRVTYTINLYESLDYATTSIMIAGTTIIPLEQAEYTPETITVKNNLQLPISFTINGEQYSELPDVLYYEATTDNREVAREIAGYKLQTQNVKGTTGVTIKITGYDNFGVKQRVATFKINITVHVPLSDITVFQKEVTLYNYDTINVVQKEEFGSYEVTLNTQPAHASYTFDDIEWLVVYNGVTYNLRTDDLSSEAYDATAQTYTYTLRPQLRNISIIVKIFENDINKAVVSCGFLESVVSNVSFKLIARIGQHYINENGQMADATRQVDINFNVLKPTKVEYFLFDDVETVQTNSGEKEYYITFDERDLGYTDTGYTVNNVKSIGFEIYPKTALLKELDVISNNSAIDVEINNVTGKLIVTAKTKILSEYSTAKITIWTKDSVSVIGGMGATYTEITIRILNGTRYAPYQVETVEDLQKINSAMNAHYVLADNINIGEWKPLGYVDADNVVPFKGSFSGVNKTYNTAGDVIESRQYYLSNLQITQSHAYMGLFAMIGSTGVVEDVVINGLYISNPALIATNNYYVGSIAGYSEGTIKNIIVDDLSGVDNFNGSYFDNQEHVLASQTTGIYIGSSSTLSSSINFFVGGVVGFVNNPNLSVENGTAESSGLINSRNENIGAYQANNAAVELLNSTDITPIQILDVVVNIEINVGIATNVSYVGGLVGFNNKAIIQKTENISASNGINESDIVASINSRVQTSSHDNSAYGGLAGFNNGEIYNYKVKAMLPSNKAISTPEAKLNNVGGLVGYNAGAVENNTVTPLVKGFSNIGGLIGTSENTVVKLNNNGQTFINGIVINDASTLVSFLKLLNIEYVTYENLLVREQNDAYNDDAVTVLDLLASDLDADISNDSIVSSLLNFTRRFYNVSTDLNREHLAVLEVTNKNVNYGTTSKAHVYKPNTTSANVIIVKNGTSFTIQSYVDANGAEGVISVETIVKTLVKAKINQVSSNHVEILEGESIADYKTAVSGYNNVGGLIGSYTGLFYQTLGDGSEIDQAHKDANIVVDNNRIYAVTTYTSKPFTATLKLVFTNILEYNSVYSYLNSQTLVNRWEALATNGQYYGDVLLERSAEKYNVGGLIGQSNNAFIQNNSVNAGVQGYNANVAGLIGQSKNVIQIIDNYFVGGIINAPVSADAQVQAQRGYIIGDASLAQQTGLNYGEIYDTSIEPIEEITEYYYAPYPIVKDGENINYYNNIVNTYVSGPYNNEVGIGFVGNNVSSTHVYKMLNKYVDINQEFEFIADATQPVYNVSFNNTDYLYYSYNRPGIKIGGLFDTLNDGIDAAILQKYSKTPASVYNLESNADVSSLKTVYNYYDLTNDGVVANGLNIAEDSLNVDDAYNVLKNYRWYYYSSINNGLPVLLSKEKVEADSDMLATIKLLANFPPTSITVELHSNMQNIWAQEADFATTLYYHSLSQDNYDISSGNLLFGKSNLKQSEINSLTNRVNNQVISKNTYLFEDVLRYISIPSFIGKDKFNVRCSNTQILSIEQNAAGKQCLVAKGSGVVTLTISSIYNTSLSCVITINVVNAINNSELSYYTSGTKNIVENNGQFVVTKSTDQNQQTFILNSDLTSKMDFVYGSIDKTFNLTQNQASGIRYYLLANRTFTGANFSILHINTIDSLEHLKINNKTFTLERINNVLTSDGSYKPRYVYYIDVPTGTTANFVGFEESNMQLLAVPYFVAKNSQGNDVINPIIKVTKTVTISGQTYDYGAETNIVKIGDVGVAGIYNPTGDASYEQYLTNALKVFNVQVRNGSYYVEKSINSINFEVQQTPYFYIDVITDNKYAILYATYNGEYNEERTIAVSRVETQVIGGVPQTVLERTFEELTINGLTLKLSGIDTSSFDDTNVTQKYVRYHFNVEVKDENKLNITEVVNKTFNFFIVKDNASIVFDATGTYVTSDLSNIILNKTQLPIVLNPQNIVSISLKHYPNGESNTSNANNGEQTTVSGLSEEAYNNIIPGYTGVLKINVSPVFANYDKVVLTSTTVQDSVVWFNQVLANMVLNKNGDYVFDGSYSTIPGANDISGRIELDKTSYRTSDGVVGFDGFIYVKTLINSFVDEGYSFVLTAEAYKNGVAVKAQPIELDVKTTPTLNLHVDGRDNAAVARGTTLTFNADHEGIEGEVDFTGSYVYKNNTNGTQTIIGGFGSYFNIYKSGDKYILDTNKALDKESYICISGVITKEINGEIYTKSDILNIKVSDFVINSITVENVVNGNFVGLFNQTYSLIVRIDDYTCHSTLASAVAEQVKQLEKQFSSVNNTLSASGAWYVGTESKHSTIALGTNATQTFKFGKASSEALDETVYTIQNIKFNSSDKLLARAMYCYTDEGIKPILSNDDYKNYANDPFTYDRYFGFGFNFYRVRNEDKPDPIATVEEFKAMEDGVDYILVNDLVLDDWTPFKADMNINSLDGNGYVITINGFNLVEDAEATVTDKQIGLFSQINENTVIKNLIIEVKPNLNIGIANETADKMTVMGDIDINAEAYKNVTFGLLAGVNYGMVTNVQIVNDANRLRLDREVIIARNSYDDADYATWWAGDVFDEVAFVNDHPEYNYIATLEEQPDGEYKVVYTLRENPQRDLTIVKVNTQVLTENQEHYMGLMVGKNEASTSATSDSKGYITNSSVENITLNGIGYVAGFVASNTGKISTSYFKGANIINRAGVSDANKSATGGFVVFNKGTNASIQYSYVEGRLGDGDNFRLSADATDVTKSANSDKTGLSSSFKETFAGHKYNLQTSADDYNYEIAGLRAMNSAISSSTDASAFVYENDASISNSYANILVNTSKSSSGFVFSNLEKGKINACFTLSSIPTSSMAASPFTGRDGQYNYNVVTPDSITNSHYLKLGADTGDSELEKDYGDAFLDANELGTGIGASQFYEYNTFQSFAFNTDFTFNTAEEVTRAVWFIPNVTTKQIYEEHFKNNFYSLSRPQLVAANLKTQSIRVWAGTETSTENTYRYVSDVIGEDLSNPILIKSAEDFNNYLNYESQATIKDRNFAIRFISDIAFNKTDLKANTYDMEFYGDLDGNGMAIGELRLISDTDFETNSEGQKVEYLGLFGRIITKNPGKANAKRGVVRNLNINVAEVRGSKVTYVGSLAGEIQNANVFNINITGEEVIQGKNIVGGLAGIISGDSEVVNITSLLSAKASYYKYPNLFKATNSQLEDSQYGKFEIYNKTEVGGALKVKNAETISYVGGIAGVYDVDPRPENEQNKQSLFNAKARSLEVNGNVSLVGEVVGGVFGLIGKDSTSSDIKFYISDGASPELIGSRVIGGLAGENRGSIERAVVSHTNETQKEIDNAYKASAVGTTYKIKNAGYSDLFKGNAHFIGGMVGFNNGGEISNSYSKVNVVNLDSLYAGGLVGLNSGGKINIAYTSGSVSAFRGVGGLIGMQTKQLVSVAAMGKEINKDIVANTFLDYSDTDPNTNITVNNLSSSKTALANVVAANVWRQEDIYTDRSVNYNGNKVMIGALIGNMIATPLADGNTYNLNDVFRDKDPVDNRRANNESIYFVQPLIDAELGITLGETPTELQQQKLMPEIGAIYNNTTINSRTGTKKIEQDVRFGATTNYAGVSGLNTITNSEGTVINHSFFSRLQNIGSARTHAEIFGTQIVIDEAKVWGDKSITSQASNFGNEKDVTDGIFENWSLDYWVGVQKDGEEITAADVNTAYPYLEPKAIKSRILVYNIKQLKQMETYKKAEFILQNDIDIADSNWVPVGTIADPFVGSIHSQANPDGSYYNFRIYDSSVQNGTIAANAGTYNTEDRTYLGLVGVSEDAYFHHFTLDNIKIISADATYVGSLFAYAKTKGRIANFAATNIRIETAASGTVGGIFGFGETTVLTDVLAKGVTIKVNGISETTALDETTLLGFGGIGGISNSYEEETVVAASVRAENIDLNLQIGNTKDIATAVNGYTNSFKMGVSGVFGMVNSGTGLDTSISGASALNIKLTANIDFKDTTKVQYFGVGGIVGYANLTSVNGLIYTQEDIMTGVVSTYSLINSVSINSINVDVQNYSNELDVGGAIGVIAAATGTTGVENIQVTKSAVDTGKISVKNNTLSQINATNVAGVVGKVQNTNIVDVSAELEEISVNKDLTDESSAKTRVGGIAGSIENATKVANGYTKINKIYVQSAISATHNLITSIGGAFGEVDLSADSSVPTNVIIGSISRIVSNVNTLESYSTVTSATKLTKNIGGLIGTLHNGSVNESGANVNIVNGANSTINGNYNIGGFVGVVDIDPNNKIISAATNISRAVITNSYSTGYIEDNEALKATQSRDGLFVGAVNYKWSKAANGALQSLVEIGNNIAVGHYVHNNSKGSKELYLNTDKGGFIGGFTESVTGSATNRYSNKGAESYKNRQNILFVENFYNMDLVPHSNEIVSGLTTEDMLFNSETTFAVDNTDRAKVWDTEVWDISNNKYPMLKWISESEISYAEEADAKVDGFKFVLTGDINDTADDVTISAIADYRQIKAAVVTNRYSNNQVDFAKYKSVNFANVSFLQSLGTKINPADSYQDSHNAVILSGSFGGTTVANKVIYFKNGAGLSANVTSVDKNSVIYGLTSSSKVVQTNNGLITSVRGTTNIINTNNGVLFNVQTTGLTFTNNAFVDATISNGVITNNGTIYSSKVSNQTLTGGTILSSYSANGLNFKIYDSEGAAHDITVDGATNKATYDGSEYSLAKLVHGGEGLFDFNNIWTAVVPSAAQMVKFNYGLPVLQVELKENVHDKQLAEEYNWSNDNVTEEQHNDFIAKYAGTVITVESEEDLAEISTFANYGYKTVTYAVENPALAASDEFTGNVNKYGNVIITNNYNYGVRTTTNRTLYNFEGKTITLVNTVNELEIKEFFFNDKLWLPIGYGASNIPDSKLVQTTSTQAYLKDTYVGAADNNNMFKGSIAGNKHVLSGLSAIGNNTNVGLFGSVHLTTEQHASNERAFAKDILIKDSNFVSTGDAGTAGALAGFAYASSNAGTAGNIVLTNKVGTKHANVYGKQVGSGLVGKVVFGNNNYVLNINKAYVNSDVYGTKASGIAKVYNGTGSSTSNLIKVDQFYYVGTLDSQEGTRALIADNNNANAKTSSVYAVNYTDTVLMLNTTAGKQNITARALGTEMLNGFDWVETWVRTNPGEYPEFNSKVEYWIKNADESLNVTTNLIQITTPSQLARIAKEVANGNTFEGKTIQINNSLELGGRVWTPIGYYMDDATLNKPFRGTLKGKSGSNIKLQNIMSTAVYVEDPDNLQTGVESITNNGLGLVGYAENATIDNLTISSCIIYGEERIGTVAGFARDTVISNCSNGDEAAISIENTSTFVGGRHDVGGLVGYFQSTAGVLNLNNNTNRAYVNYAANTPSSDDKYFGGIAGTVQGINTGSVLCNNNKNIMNVVGYSYVGGLFGSINGNVTVNCVGDVAADNTGSVTGDSYVAGIVAYVTNGAKVTSVNNSGAITASAGDQYAAGIVADLNNGQITLAINNGSVSAAKAAGIVGKVSGTNNHVGNVLNNASSITGTSVAGIISTSSMAYEQLLGLCVDAGSLKPIADNNSNAPYRGVFNKSVTLTDASFNYGYNGASVSYRDIISQNPYWTIDGSNVIGINYTVNDPLSASKSEPLTYTYTATGEECYHITTQNEFNYVSWLIATNFVNSNVSTIIKPLYFSSVALSGDFRALAGSSAYPIKTNIYGGTNVTISTADSSVNPKALFGYAYGNKNITITNIAVDNKQSTNIYRFASTGTLFKDVYGINLSNITVTSRTYYFTEKSGTVAKTLNNSNVSGVVANGTAKASGSNIGGITAYAGNGTTIDNCANNINITASSVAGGIVAEADAINIINGCSNTGTIDLSGGYGGGIAGSISSSTIRDAINNVGADLYGANYMGGIVGNASSSTITSSVTNYSKAYNAANIDGDNYVGGIAGQATSSTISNMLVRGTIYGDAYVGGVVGRQSGGSTTNCAVKPVTVVIGADYIGGVVGYLTGSGTITNNTLYGNEATSQSKSVYVIATIHSTGGAGGVVGYYENGSLTGNTVNNAYVGNGTTNYFYTIQNVDDYSANYRTHSRDFTDGGTYAKDDTPSTFKYGSIYGNRGSSTGDYAGYNTFTNSGGRKLTKFVDEYTVKTKWTHAGGFAWAITYGHVKIVVYKREAEIGAGQYGGYGFGSASEMTSKETVEDISGWWQGGEVNMYGSAPTYSSVTDEGFVIGDVDTVTVTYNYNVSGITNETREIVSGMTAPNLSKERSGYVLQEWKLNGSTFDFTTAVTSDITLVAQWAETDKYKIEFDLQGGSGTFNTIKVAYEDTIDEDDWPSSNPTKSAGGTNLTFKGWYQVTYQQAVKSWNNLPAESKEGTTFQESFDYYKFEYDDNYEITHDYILYAHWNKAVVTFMNGATTFNTSVVDWNTAIAKPATDPTQSGKTFQYWATKSGEDYTEYNFANGVIADLTLHAVYSDANVTVTFYDDASNIATSYGTNGVQTIAKGSKLTRPTDPVRSGFDFDGWYTRPYGGEANYSTYKFDFNTAINANLNLYQYFVAKTWTVQFRDASGNSLQQNVSGVYTDIADQNIVTGGTASRPIIDPYKDGYTFAGWYTSSAFTTEFNFTGTVINANTTIYAKFNVITHEVKFINQDGSSIDSISIQTVNHGSNATRPSDPPAVTGKVFRNWYSVVKPNNSIDYEAYIFDFSSPITADTFVYAYYQDDDIVYNVTFVDAQGNELTGAAFTMQQVAFKGTVTLPTEDPVDPEDAVNSFIGWFTCARGSLTEAEYMAFEFDPSTQIINDTIIYAYWERPDVVITFVDPDGNAFSPAISVTVKKGDLAEAPSEPTPPEGYTFAGWYKKSYTTFENDANPGDVYDNYKFDFDTTAITSNITLYAYFVAAS